MDLQTAKGFERNNRQYNWKCNYLRAYILRDQGYSWDYDSTSYIVFCNRAMLHQETYTRGSILDNFLSCLRVAEAHMRRTQ